MTGARPLEWPTGDTVTWGIGGHPRGWRLQRRWRDGYHGLPPIDRAGTCAASPRPWASGGHAVPGDYDGDGRPTMPCIALHRRWYVRGKVPGCGARRARAGAAAYNGDGVTDIAVYRRRRVCGTSGILA